MDAGTHSLRVIFGQDRRHVVPLYQRPYVWGQQVQWAPLWEDLREIAERALAGQPPRPHFMGAIVLDQADVPYGTVETRWVIDGQQRLTTLQIVLEAFSDCCGAHGFEAHDRAAKRLTRNDDPLITEDDHKFKIWPTNADQEHFRRVMNAGNPKEVLTAYKMPSVAYVGHPIADAYLFFFRQIDAWFKDEAGKAEDRAKALFAGLKDAIRLVVIDLKEGDDAQLIFETLNARGTPLLPSDLVKNYLFIKAADQGLDREKLYKKYWEPFDTDAGYWRQIVGRGHSQRARLDLFIQHYLTLKTRDEVPVAHLYAVFKTFAAKKVNTSAEEHLADLKRYATIYRSFDSLNPQSLEGRFFRRLTAMDVGTALPFLLEIFHRLEDQKPALQTCLRQLESFLVRRMVCQMNTRAYNRLFKDLLKTFDETDVLLPVRLEKELSSGTAEYNIWPSDAEVLQSLRETPIYRTLVRERVRMLLEALNDGLQAEKSEQVINETLTIEHLMPQTWTTHWSLPEGHSDAEIAERNQLVHTLGNLTLLNRKLNPAISNGKWHDKRKEIHAYSLLNLNRQLPPEWSDETIKSRTEELAYLTTKIWDAPPSVKSAGLRTVLIKPVAAVDSDVPVFEDEGPKPTTQRQQILHRFWTALLARAKGRTTMLANRSATTDCWLSVASGLGGFGLVLTITQEIARIECYIRVKNGQDVHNKAIFHELLAQRETIEQEFGGPLDWQELPGRIGCRICTVVPGSWQMTEQQWPALHDQMINLLIDLERALHNPIREINVEAIIAAETA